MPETLAETRSDPAVAGEIIDSVFEQAPRGAKLSCIEFLAASIEYLSEHHPDRWGVTLFGWGLRLNAGWVECLVLHAGGLRVLVDQESVPVGTKLDVRSYRYARVRHDYRTACGLFPVHGGPRQIAPRRTVDCCKEPPSPEYPQRALFGCSGAPVPGPRPDDSESLLRTAGGISGAITP